MTAIIAEFLNSRQQELIETVAAEKRLASVLERELEQLQTSIASNEIRLEGIAHLLQSLGEAGDSANVIQTEYQVGISSTHPCCP